MLAFGYVLTALNLLKLSNPALPALLAAICVLPSCSGGGGGSNDTGGGTTPAALTGNVLFQPFTGTKTALFLPVKFRDAASLFDEGAPGLEELESIQADIEQALFDDSYGAVRLVSDLAWPPVLVDRNVGSYDPRTGFIHLRADARLAARLAGYAVDSYDRILIFSEKVWGGPQGHAWMDTSWQAHKERWVTFHEIGHSLGRPHAEFWDGDPVGTGKSIPYGDLYDPMGGGRMQTQFRHTNPFFKLRSGWVQEDEVTEVQTSGTYRIQPLEAPDPTRAPTALRIRQDATRDYWIFYRATSANVADGPVILRTISNPHLATSLLDMKRGTLTGLEAEDAALAPGATFLDAAAGISVKNVSTAGDGIELEITVDEARQQGMDLVPIIQVVSPLLDTWPTEGSIEFEVRVAEPDIGDLNGEGIDSVTLSVRDTHTDPPQVLLSKTLTEQPFMLTVDSIASALADDFYILQVTANASDGGSNTVWFRFTVDNYERTIQ